MNLPQYITEITFVNWKEKGTKCHTIWHCRVNFQVFFFSFPLVMLCCAKGFYVKAYGITLPCNPAFWPCRARWEKGEKSPFFTQNPSGSLSRAEFMITMMQRCHSHGSLLRFAIWASQRVSSSIRQRPRRSARMPRARWLDVYNSSHRCRLKLWNVVMHAWVLVVNMPSWRKTFIPHLCFCFSSSIHSTPHNLFAPRMFRSFSQLLPKFLSWHASVA